MALLKVLICALSLSLALSQVSFPTTSPIQSSSTTSTITQSNGYIVTMNAAGWVVGDAITLSASAPVTVVTTLLATPSSGATGVGLVAVGGNGGNTAGTSSAAIVCAPATAFTGLTNLEGKAPTALPGTGYPTTATPPGQCPVDFITLYSAAPTVAQISTGGVVGATGVSQTTMKLIVNSPVTWQLSLSTPPTGATGTQNCNIAAISAPGFAPITLNPLGACGAGGEKYFEAAIPGTTATASFYSYSFYVNAEAAGSKVCFQSGTQFQSYPACGNFASSSSSSKSSNILAVLGAPLLLILAAL